MIAKKRFSLCMVNYFSLSMASRTVVIPDYKEARHRMKLVPRKAER